jgi:signal transduction histidine kinase
MTIRLLKGLGIGVFFFLMLYFGGKEMLYPFLMTSNHMTEEETELVNNLQEYISENHLSTRNYQELKDWVSENKIDKLIISRGRWVLFDSSYDEQLNIGSKEILNISLKRNYSVCLTDGMANVFVDAGITAKYNNILLGISVIAGLFICLWIFSSGMHEDIIYIQQLEKEVSIITQGNLQKSVTIQGNDELTDLAQGLDSMRSSLLERKCKEEEMRLAQEKLVLGMSHDLRTPLTGLMTYMEVIKQQQIENHVVKEYLDKALDKIIQIRGLSDELFEYFQVTSHDKIQMEPPEDIMSVFGDYLSEVISFLECNGYRVNAQFIEWKPVCVQVNMNYIGRIFNNMISNLEKYAEKSKEVLIHLQYENNGVGILIQNGIARSDKTVKGTGIGTKNIALMMEQMNGKMESFEENGMYSIILFFPVV